MVFFYYHMWKCSKCEHKNNNSSEKCHGQNCNGIKSKDGILPLQEIAVKKKKEAKKVLDYCSSCKKDRFFTPTKWQGKRGYWRCESGKHRPCELVGRTKPIMAYLPKVDI